MEHRRPGHGPAGGPLTGEPPAEGPGGRPGGRPGDTPRPAPPAGPGGAGDTRVAGNPPVTPAMDAPGPEPVPDTAPDPVPGKGAPASPAGAPAPSSAGAPEKLLDPAESERFRERWREVQSAFVDDPGESVRKADDLASEAVDALGRAIAGHRRALSDGTGGREHADTERLRLALRGYRDLLDRIFAA